ncbi:MAG: hypothetical protein U0V48_01840 [Anaerolineales bacterium]
MNKNRFLLVLVIAALTLATVSFAVAPKASQPYPDYAQRHAGEVLIPVTGNSEANTDYFQRHRNEVVRPVDTTDYFQRHPELTVSAATSRDLTDYFFRQTWIPWIPARVPADLTDYFFRYR